MRSTKHSGSETFSTNQIKTDEYVLMARVMVNEGISVQQAALEIQAIDDMLTMKTMEPIMRSMRYTKTGRVRKNQTIQSFIEERIEKLISEINELNFKTAETFYKL